MDDEASTLADRAAEFPSVFAPRTRGGRLRKQREVEEEAERTGRSLAQVLADREREQWRERTARYRERHAEDREAARRLIECLKEMRGTAHECPYAPVRKERMSRSMRWLATYLHPFLADLTNAERQELAQMLADGYDRAAEDNQRDAEQLRERLRQRRGLVVPSGSQARATWQRGVVA